MIVSFGNTGTEDLYDGRDTKAARRVCPKQLHRIALRKLTMLNGAASLQDLKHPPANRLEALKGDRAGQFSVRINDQYRVCFIWSSEGPSEVEIVDYH
jgi:toxin HigB-1